MHTAQQKGDIIDPASTKKTQAEHNISSTTNFESSASVITLPADAVQSTNNQLYVHEKCW